MIAQLARGKEKSLWEIVFGLQGTHVCYQNTDNETFK